MLLALNNKLAFFDIFESCRNSKAKENSKTLKKQFKLFCNELSEALKAKLSDMRADKAKAVFQGVKSLRRY
jgi:predicted secreted protein